MTRLKALQHDLFAAMTPSNAKTPRFSLSAIQRVGRLETGEHQLQVLSEMDSDSMMLSPNL